MMTTETMTMIPKHRPPTHAGEILLEEFLKPLNLTQVEAAEPGVERMRDGDADVEGADEEGSRGLDAGIDDARDDAYAAERREILVAELERALHGKVRIGCALQECFVPIG